MASRTAGRASSSSPQRPPPPMNNDIDDYDVDDDPFADSGGEGAGPPAQNNNAQSKKRKDATGLGIDEEVAVAKKVRAPAVKLDETRLLSEKGIPRLRRKARDLKFKGKGHEFSDAARLLSFYQLWLDDLFPKAKFTDALAMVEKTGHKKFMRVKRMEWIDEGKPKPPRDDDDDDDIFGGGGSNGQQPEERDAAKFPARVAPIFQNRGSQRPKTPPAPGGGDDLFGDEDIYGATPKAPKPTAPTGSNSLFGSGAGAQASGGDGDIPEDDDLDALMAEEEAQQPAPTAPIAPAKSIFGSGAPSRPRDPIDDDDDLDALMAEAETQTNPPKPSSHTALKQDPSAVRAAAVDDEDNDLDALMAEAEAMPANPPKQAPTKEGQAAAAFDGADADEEEAMAEMDGLW